MSVRRKFTRKSGFRDSRLLIIASEGTSTERIYFESLKTNYLNPRVHVEVLRRLETASDPLRILKLLDQFCSKYYLRKGFDQLWLVIDVDRWGESKLSLICQLCGQKGYLLAISNPAFEIWLLMHVRSINSYSPDEKRELLINNKKGNRTRLEQELLNLLGIYNKTNPNMEFFNQNLFVAIKNAEEVDIHPENRWPNELGTRVYLLAREII